MASLMLGERLTQLRSILMEEAFAPAAWSRASVAYIAGVSPAALARLEKTGTGTAVSLGAVLAYYQTEGFNLAWVLTPDNANIPLRGFRDIFQDEKLPQAGEPLAGLHRLLQPTMAALDAGQVPGSDALRALLTQVQQGILHALMHLLPPRRLVISEADLRAYQRQLPPVPAQSAGWRSASLYAVPYHYYAAGESLPWCGDAFSYLTYDPGLPDFSDSLKCGRCRHWLNEDVSAGLPLKASATTQP